MADNYIRLKQLHNPEISGFVLDVVSGAPLLQLGGDTQIVGDFKPGSSGVYDLGSQSLPFQDLYIASGDNIYFGQNKHTVSGTYLLIDYDTFSVVIPYFHY